MRPARSQLVSTGLILLLSLAAAVAVTWLIPSLSAASVNMLFRFRGRVEPPRDIVIVAVDDASLQRVGNWPWPRSVMAEALDRITAGHPRAVAYISYADGGRQGGIGMPGVEVHANVIETMRRGVWLTPRADSAGFAVALLVILCAACSSSPCPRATRASLCAPSTPRPCA